MEKLKERSTEVIEWVHKHAIGCCAFFMVIFFGLFGIHSYHLVRFLHSYSLSLLDDYFWSCFSFAAHSLFLSLFIDLVSKKRKSK